MKKSDSPDYLARHLARQIKTALRGLSGEERKRRQIKLANGLLGFIQDRADSLEADVIEDPGKILRSVYSGPVPPLGPTTPLSATNLLMNAVGEPRLGFELEREMSTADKVFMVVSFVQWRGWQRLKTAFHALADRNAPVRILTTTYIGATELNSGLLFVTLDKSEKTFSPTTRYEDFALSPSQFHWQSQSTTGENSPTGQLYVHQQENGAKFLLFVRPTKNDAFVFLGPVNYLSHSGTRPMSIYWQLENPMPAWFFEICASLRVA